MLALLGKEKKNINFMTPTQWEVFWGKKCKMDVYL